jgi:hypothetical protein
MPQMRRTSEPTNDLDQRPVVRIWVLQLLGDDSAAIATSGPGRSRSLIDSFVNSDIASGRESTSPAHVMHRPIPRVANRRTAP